MTIYNWSLALKRSLRDPGPTSVQSLPVALMVGVVLASLSVGDGLFEMVERNTDANLSETDTMLTAPSFVSEDILDSALSDPRSNIDNYAPVISLPAVASRTDGGMMKGIRLMGVRESILELAPIHPSGGAGGGPIPGRYEAVVNVALAEEL